MAWTRIDRANVNVAYAGKDQLLVDRGSVSIALFGIDDQIIYRVDVMVAYRDPLPDDDDDPDGPGTFSRLTTAGFARVNSSTQLTEHITYMTAGMTAWNE